MSTPPPPPSLAPPSSPPPPRGLSELGGGGGSLLQPHFPARRRDGCPWGSGSGVGQPQIPLPSHFGGPPSGDAPMHSRWGSAPGRPGGLGAADEGNVSGFPQHIPSASGVPRPEQNPKEIAAAAAASAAEQARAAASAKVEDRARWNDLLCKRGTSPSDMKELLEGVRRVGTIPDASELVADAVVGRRGDPTVRLERRDCIHAPPVQVGLVPVGNTYEFTTTVGTASVTSGKWMYEATLYTSGLLQVGWATLTSQWSRDHGVGDNINTYSYDGYRVRKWNVSQQPYGVQWEVGDVVTNCIDLDTGSVDWYLNGQHLGSAFADIDTMSTHASPGYERLVFVPAVSINNSQLAGINFGAVPFRHPIPGYNSLQRGRDSMASSCRPLVEGIRVASELVCKGDLSPQPAAAACMTIFRRLFRIVDVFRNVFSSQVPEYPQHLLVFCASVWIPLLEEALEESGAECVRQIAKFSLNCLDPATASGLWHHTLRILCHRTATSHHFDVEAQPIVQACTQAVPLLFDDDNTAALPSPHPRIAYLRKKPSVEMDEVALPGGVYVPSLPSGNGSGSALRVGGSALPLPGASPLGRPQQTLGGGPPALGDDEAWGVPAAPPAVPSVEAMHRQTHFAASKRRRKIARRTDVLEGISDLSGERIKFNPCAALRVLAEVTSVERVVRMWHESPTIHRDIVDLCTHKQPNGSVRRLLLPHVWWGGAEGMRDAVSDFEDLSASSLRDDMAFLKKNLVVPTDAFRHRVVSNVISFEGSQSHVERLLDKTCSDGFQHLTDGQGAALMRLFLFLFPALTPEGCSVEELYPPSALVGRTTSAASSQRQSNLEMHAGIDRLGGLLSHLKAGLAPGKLDGAESQTDTGALFERLVLLYHSGVRRHIMWTANCLAERAKAVAKLQAIFKGPGRDMSERQIRSVIGDVAEATRRCSWEELMMFSIDGESAPHGMAIKRVFGLFLRILSTYDGTEYFPFVPSFFLEALVTIVYYRRKTPHEFHEMLEQEPELLPFLFRHVHDERIVHPDLRETILGVIASVFDVNDPLVCQAFKERPCMMPSLIKAVLRCFQDKQLWISSLSVIIRLTKFLEFCCVDEQVLMMLVEWRIVPNQVVQPPSVDSAVWLCQEWHRSVVDMIPSLPRKNTPGNPDGVAAPANDNVHDFIKELFNRVGWAMAELTNCLTEQRELDPSGNLLPQHRHVQKKCGMMCDLTRRLLQVLEACTLVMPSVFLPDFNACCPIESRKTTNLQMLVEVLLHMLQKYSASLSRVSLSSADRARLLCPLAGCFVNMLFVPTPPAVLDPRAEPKPVDISNPLLYQLSKAKEEWTPEDFLFIIDLDWEKELGVQEGAGCKLDYLRHPSVSQAIHDTHRAWLANKKAEETQAEAAGDDSLCCICYIAAANTTFSCGHNSCCACITRQLVYTNRCFFCNAEVSWIQPEGEGGERERKAV